jgi:non-ribosomal peptide synthetase component F/aryl carrier-like protein
MTPFWQTYYNQINPSKRVHCGDTNSQLNVHVPDEFQQMCKGNINNAKILLASCLQELSMKLIGEAVYLAFSLDSKAIPLDGIATGDFRSTAKKILEFSRIIHPELSRIPSIHTSGIVISDSHYSGQGSWSVQIEFSDHLDQLTIRCDESYLLLFEILLTCCLRPLQPLEETKRLHLKELMNEAVLISEQYRATAEAVITTVWKESIGNSPDFEKSYFANGGDSIQAIRLLSKLKAQGYQGNFGELLVASALGSWKIKKANVYQEIETQVDRYPLSIMQQKIWNQATANRKGIYHEQFLFELFKCPEPEKLKMAYDRIWKAYPQLRISPVFENGSWQQVVNEWPADFRILNSASTDLILEQDLNDGFTGPLMRCSFFEWDGKAYLLWSHHHVLLDGWSVGLLIQEFIQVLDSDSELEGRMNYQHVLVSRELALKSTAQISELGHFFREHAALKLNSNRSVDSKFEELNIYLDSPNLSVFCKSNGFTEQQVFLTALSMTNYRLNGTSNSYIHSISNGRSIAPEYAETAIGLFIKNIFLGWDWTADQTVRQLIQNVSNGQQFALGYEHLSEDDLSEVVEEIPDVLFVFENYPYNKVDGLSISGTLVSNHELTGYPLTILIMPTEAKYQIKAIYDSGSFSNEFIAYFLKCIQENIGCILDSLDEPFEKSIGSFPQPAKLTEPILWTEAVEHHLMHSDSVILDSFSERALSFSDTSKFTENLYGYLTAHAKSKRIALFGEKTEYTPALIYAIMRSGYTYVPLNPSWPLERIQQVLEISECSMVIFPEDIRLNLNGVDSVALNDILKEYPKSIEAIVNQDQEAYILFTSGSTGKPKGVALTHQNLSSFLDACRCEIDSDGFDHIFSLTNLGFDLSIFENLFGLYTGKNTIIIRDLSHLEISILKHPGGLLNTVPSVLSKLQGPEIKGLNAVNSAGEPFHEQLWNHLKSHNEALVIKNWYGPTETTTYSTCIDLSQNYSTSIGTALPYEELFVCDHLLHILPEGVEGEIIIGGAGVATGYLNSEGGFFEVNGLQYYRTGDRGVMSNGQFYLKGRNDRQVKRLGQRFELGEVEQKVLNKFQEVKRARYIQSENTFILFIERENTDVSDVVAFIELVFPAYMRPDRIFSLAHFPENANGKIDELTLLRTHKYKGVESDFEGNAPLLLQKLRSISLFEMLNGNFGFIEQGGDSILGLRLIGKLKSWGYKAEINELMNAPKLNDYLNSLGQLGVSSKKSDSLPLTPIQEWFHSEYSGNRNRFNQSILLEIQLPLNSDFVATILKKTLESFKLLSMVYSYGWKAGLSPEVRVENCQTENEVTSLCDQIQGSFDLLKGPVAGAAVIDFNEQKLLFISMHHFYCDGFSWRLLLDELRARLNGGGSEYESFEVFAKVRDALQQKVESSGYLPTPLLDPFAEWEVASYEESSYTEWTWTEVETDRFIRNWLPELNSNEKFLYLIAGAWEKAELPPVTPVFETHGRSYAEITELSESLGWFTQFYPVELDFDVSKANLLERVRFAMKNVPENGLLYMGHPSWKKPPFPLLLNYLGSFDENWGGMARPSDIGQGDMVDQKNFLLGHVEINALIVEGKMRWMLRTHPSFDSKHFEEALTSFSKENISAELQGETFIHDSVDSDDMNAIDDLLSDL